MWTCGRGGQRGMGWIGRLGLTYLQCYLCVKQIANGKLRVPWTARRSSQSILKEISPEYSLEGLMLSWNSNTLATWCEELTPWKRPWCRERLRAGGKGDDRGWDGWMVSPTQWTWVWASSGVGDGQGGLACCNPWDRKELDTTEKLNWLNRAVGSCRIAQGAQLWALW